MRYEPLLVRYFPTGDTGPVRDFLHGLMGDPNRRAAAAKLEADIRALAEGWPITLRADVKTLRGLEPLRELRRLHGKIAYRIVFAVRGKELWLLSAFEKKSKKTPASELAKAESRFKSLPPEER